MIQLKCNKHNIFHCMVSDRVMCHRVWWKLLIFVHFCECQKCQCYYLPHLMKYNTGIHQTWNPSVMRGFTSEDPYGKCYESFVCLSANTLYTNLFLRHILSWYLWSHMLQNLLARNILHMILKQDIFAPWMFCCLVFENKFVPFLLLSDSVINITLQYWAFLPVLNLTCG